MSPVCQQKLNRLKQIIKERENWREPLEEVDSMRQWTLDAESILNGSWAEQHEPILPALPCVTHEQVGLRFDRWRAELAESHKRDKIIPTLEHRWAAAASSASCIQTPSLH